MSNWDLGRKNRYIFGGGDVRLSHEWLVKNGSRIHNDVIISILGFIEKCEVTSWYFERD